MHRPQVLVFIDWYLPGYKAGGPVRSLANMVDHLRDRVDFHIVTADTDYTECMPYAGIVPDQWSVLPGGERVWYASQAGIGRGRWKRLLQDGSWDAVYINGIYSYWFSIMPVLMGTGRRRIIAVRGMLAKGPMRHGRLKKAYFLRLMRMLGFYRNVEFQATNVEEVTDIQRWIGRDAVIHLVPNLPRKLDRTALPWREKRPGELRLVSVARIAVEKNTLLAIESLKAVKGDVRFDLHGPVYDEAYWGRCRSAIATLPANVRVKHHGTIMPDGVPQLFRDHHALLMPSEGENFGHTMLEALTAGLPLVISDRTPWKDLERQRAGWDLPLDRPDTFTRAIQRIADMDQTTYDAWSAGAFALGARYLGDPAPIEKSLALFTR